MGEAVSVSLRDVKSNGCRWIIGEPDGAATKVCGVRTRNGGSWCPTHQKKVYAKNQKIANAKMNWYANSAGYPR